MNKPVLRKSGRPGIRNLFLSCMLAIVSGSPASAGSARPDRMPEGLSIQEIGPGVWLHVSWMTLSNGSRFPANGLIVRDGDELILVDTAWGPDNTAALLELIDAELRLPVSTAIVTHFHDDSMGGTGVLEDRGIAVVGGPLTRALGGDGPLPETIPGLARTGAVTFRNLEVFYPGAGHSEDNLMVWVPGARVLFGGCAIRSPTFPGRGNTADADQEHWPVAIAQVRDRYPDVGIVVPGHGPPGDSALLTHTIELFSE